MALIEVLAAGLGAGIAKGVLKVWLRDDIVLQSAGEALVDVAKQITGMPDAQKNVEKKLASIQTRAAESILNKINRDYTEISRERVEIIAEAAGTTLKSAVISGKLLVQKNLNPEKLLDHFLAMSGAEGGNPGFVGIGRTSALQYEQRIYKELLSEAAQLIVDISSIYPRLNAEIYHDLLEGQDRLLDGVDKLLTQLLVHAEWPVSLQRYGG